MTTTALIAKYRRNFEKADQAWKDLQDRSAPAGQEDRMKLRAAIHRQVVEDLESLSSTVDALHKQIAFQREQIRLAGVMAKYADAVTATFPDGGFHLDHNVRTLGVARHYFMESLKPNTQQALPPVSRDPCTPAEGRMPPRWDNPKAESIFNILHDAADKSEE